MNPLKIMVSCENRTFINNLINASEKNMATTQNLIGIDRKYSMSPIHIIALAYDINEVHHGV